MNILPQKQLRDDDCYRTCLAMMLGMDAIDVPNFIEIYPRMDDMIHLANEYLRRNHGMRLVSHEFFNKTPKKVRMRMASESPNVYYIIIVGVRNRRNHALIGYNSHIIADPSPHPYTHLYKIRCANPRDNGVIVQTLTPCIGENQ